MSMPALVAVEAPAGPPRPAPALLPRVSQPGVEDPALRAEARVDERAHAGAEHTCSSGLALPTPGAA
eukprot:CAMPEP_0179116904 /NCGR_PEP_ID=MMETSP0796-20121207/54870_1 /TAXON_ID=73915 /ORGANISM="Pyrodinium bahamense, Strain pbaha01" /LENGTH=66 /DNA_ID=CAMNT_0020815229 /DNA_START=558 /DNA_END=755 /DNA_ORIENTATION=-